MSPRQYRDFAAQCRRWAANARHEEHKSMMLRMADHWIQTAQELERTGTSRSSASRMRPAAPQWNADRQAEIAAKD
jgi:hypothetical protein